MRVGFAVDVDYPHVGEVRPRKMGQSLSQLGHHVVFVCANSRTKPLVEDLPSGRAYRFGWFTHSKLFPLISAALPFNPLWVLWIAHVARKERLDVLISSNLRLALPTVFAAKLLGLPAVVDLQENNREAVKLYEKRKLHHHIMRNSLLVGFVEDLAVKLADHTWVVVEERMQSLPARPLEQGRVSVVCHTPSREELHASQSQLNRSGHDTFNLIYLGLFSPGVGSVEPILEALPYVLESDKDVRLIIGGNGNHLVPTVQRLGIQDNVSFDGTIEPSNVPAWLSKGDLGVVAYPVNAFTNTTISNKVFHYMAAGLPILSTDMAPTRRVLDDVGCGLTIKEGSSSQKIAELILALKRSHTQRVLMGRKGREAVERKYNWDRDFSHALECLSRLTSGNADAGSAPPQSSIEDPIANHDV